MAENTIQVTDSNFDEKVLKSSVPVLVDFWAPWCAPCLSIAASLDLLASEYKGRAVVAKMNVDENADAPARYGVRSIPYLALFKDGEVVDSVVGAVPKARLAELVEKGFV